MPSLTGTGAAVYAASQKADSSLSVGSGTASVTLGNSALYVVSVSGSNGFKSPVTLSVSGLPAGTTATFAPNPNLLTTSVLTVVTTATTPVGSFTLTINATSGTLSHSLTVQLTITAPLTGFALSVSPSSVATPAGTVANYTVTITRSPLFTGAVALSLAGAPPGSGWNFSPTSTTGTTSALQVSTPANAALGGYTLTITGTSGSRTATATAKLTVNAAQGGTPFTIAGTLDHALAPGVTGVLNLAITNPNSTTLQVTNLTVSLAPPSATCRGENFTVTQFSGTYPLAVPANSTATLGGLGGAASAMPRVKMLDLPVNQDACKSAQLALSYAGTGQGG